MDKRSLHAASAMWSSPLPNIALVQTISTWNHASATKSKQVRHPCIFEKHTLLTRAGSGVAEWTSRCARPRFLDRLDRRQQERDAAAEPESEPESEPEEAE